MALSCSRAARVRVAVTVLCAAGSLAAMAGSAAAALPSVPPGFSVAQFAAGNAAMTKPDDIVRLDRHIFVTWQNGVGPQGQPGLNGATSTVVEYDGSGHVLGQWTPTGRADGIGADRSRHLIYVTVNEDANSSFYVIDPDAPTGSQMRHLTYNDPTGAVSGGTDAVSVDPRGNVYISASNPAAADSNAVALAKVDSPSVGQVAVTRTFADNAGPVQDGNHPGSTTTLGLTDPDSNAIVPEASARFARDFMLDSQGDGKLVFAPSGFSSSTPSTALTQLSLSVPGSSGQPVLDDVRWASHDGGVLYLVDQGAGVVYRVTGPFRAGSAFGSQPTDPTNPPLQADLVNINLTNGTESAFATGLNSPKGLLYVAPPGDSDHGDRHQAEGGQER